MLDSRTESVSTLEPAILTQPLPARKPLAFGWRVLGAFGVGLLLAACFPPLRLPFLRPLAIAGLLALLEGATVREGVYIGLACGFAFFGASLFWLTGMFGVSAISL
ncbi:MAG TPA: hypothetical protein VFB21_06105 [Chthonomonadaceae bacterium]|nr:hypothetical protein [Chthonomonadaceae bacterium]